VQRELQGLHNPTAVRQSPNDRVYGVVAGVRDPDVRMAQV